VTYVARSHTIFHHRNHIVWITKYRDSVLEGALRDRIRTIIRQVCKELGVQIISGVLAREHVHMFVVFSNLKVASTNHQSQVGGPGCASRADLLISFMFTAKI
jgi:REP element-mobilizing transposase RayT